jgi:hypothetical protein
LPCDTASLVVGACWTKVGESKFGSALTTLARANQRARLKLNYKGISKRLRFEFLLLQSISLTESSSSMDIAYCCERTSQSLDKNKLFPQDLDVTFRCNGFLHTLALNESEYFIASLL